MQSVKKGLLEAHVGFWNTILPYGNCRDYRVDGGESSLSRPNVPWTELPAHRPFTHGVLTAAIVALLSVCYAPRSQIKDLEILLRDGIRSLAYVPFAARSRSRLLTAQIEDKTIQN